MNEKTVYIYTGESAHATEPLKGEVTWDEGGVNVRQPTSKGEVVVFQIPWASVQYVCWVEKPDG